MWFSWRYFGGFGLISAMLNNLLLLRVSLKIVADFCLGSSAGVNGISCVKGA